MSAAWAAYLCTRYGHVQSGSGTGTNANSTVWATHCDRCGARLRPVPYHGDPGDEQNERCPACEGIDQPGVLHNARAPYCSQGDPGDETRSGT